MNQEYNDLIYHLGELKQRQVVCLVEGKKDQEALLSFGIENIIAINSRPFHQIIDEILNSYSRYSVAILTDLDQEGRKIYRRLHTLLQPYGIKIYHPFRNFLFKETELRQIEGLPTYVENIKNGNGKSNGKYRFKVRPPYYPTSFY